ncbi:hypothetical protein AAVH_35605 [Aphelenchoides avenae]|nr:hypothetical protein AAVH_35605 [Aphelenchus avenae]
MAAYVRYDAEVKRDLKEPIVQRPTVGANQMDDQQVPPDTAERILDDEYRHGIKHLLVKLGASVKLPIPHRPPTDDYRLRSAGPPTTDLSPTIRWTDHNCPTMQSLVVIGEVADNDNTPINRCVVSGVTDKIGDRWEFVVDRWSVIGGRSIVRQA